MHKIFDLLCVILNKPKSSMSRYLLSACFSQIEIKSSQNLKPPLCIASKLNSPYYEFMYIRFSSKFARSKHIRLLDSLANTTLSMTRLRNTIFAFQGFSFYPYHAPNQILIYGCYSNCSRKKTQ